MTKFTNIKFSLYLDSLDFNLNLKEFANFYSIFNPKDNNIKNRSFL